MARKIKTERLFLPAHVDEVVAFSTVCTLYGGSSWVEIHRHCLAIETMDVIFLQTPSPPSTHRALRRPVSCQRPYCSPCHLPPCHDL